MKQGYERYTLLFYFECRCSRWWGSFPCGVSGKIEYKPGAFDAFWDRDEAVSRLESEEIRKQMVELGVQMEIVQIP